MNKKSIFLIIIISLPIIILNILATSKDETQDHTITVFVHGTALAPRIIDRLPIKPLFHCPKGLFLAQDMPSNYDFYKRAEGFINLNNKLYSFDRFYFFGWKSEKIYDSVRKQAAQDLVTELQQLVEKYYKNHGVTPKIRFIGHSHGGNVVLHTANFLPLTIHNKNIEIEAWLVGVPVQKTNCDLVNSSNFTRIYSIYSDTDWMQRIDPQGLRNPEAGLKNLWSDRTFDKNSKCIQINFTVNGKSISHTSYRSLFQYFPLIQELIEEKSKNLDSGTISVNFEK